MEILLLVFLAGLVVAGLHITNRGRSSLFSAPETLGDRTVPNDLDSTAAGDIYSDPMYSHLPGNIYYVPDESSIRDDFDDICTNPAYSFLSCNIYHTDDDWHMGGPFDSSSSFKSDD